MYNKKQDFLPFMKMHGLGNDFVVIDERNIIPRVNAKIAIAMADRHRGIGFDQLATITKRDGADVHLTFWNADGSQSAACGNATRCIARYIMDQTDKKSLTISTDRGILYAVDKDQDMVAVNMGHPQLKWANIPLAIKTDTLNVPIDGNPVATGMGNPHCTFFVDDINNVDLAAHGRRIEHHPLYPQRTNVQFAQIIGPDHIRMRVWERGVGITLASGSSSCATAVAAARRGLTSCKVQIDLDGGTLWIDWRSDGVWMTGKTAHVFDGIWHL